MYFTETMLWKRNIVNKKKNKRDKTKKKSEIGFKKCKLKNKKLHVFQQNDVSDGRKLDCLHNNRTISVLMESLLREQRGGGKPEKFTPFCYNSSPK